MYYIDIYADKNTHIQKSEIFFKKVLPTTMGWYEGPEKFCKNS